MKATHEQYKHPATDIEAEIQDLQRSGYTIEQVFDTDDRAYEQPHRIDAMYRQLTDMGKVYDERARAQRPLSLAAASIYDASMQTPLAAVTTPLKSIRKRVEVVREEARADILFDSTKMPWHLQAGKALALQTIMDAHDLRPVDSNEGEYDTMSGRLPTTLPDMTFGDNAGWMAGLSLREAMVGAGQKFRGKPRQAVEKYVDAELDNLKTFLNAPVTDDFKEIVAYCHDSLGIRARKELVRDAAAEQLDWYEENRPDKKEVTFLSVGCGTAQSILEVAADARDRGLTPKIILFDQDPVALAAAMELARQMGLEEYAELHCEKLFNAKGESEVKKVLGDRKVDIGEDSGLREYLKPGVYKHLTRAVYDSLEDDGMMITGNMNKGRVQGEFLHGLMGWSPHVQMRTPKEGFRLHEQSGVPKGKTTAKVTKDTVYTVFVSTKR